MPGGMPGGFPGARAPPSGSASSGPPRKRLSQSSIDVALFQRETWEGPKFSKFCGSFQVRAVTVFFFLHSQNLTTKHVHRKK